MGRICAIALLALEGSRGFSQSNQVSDNAFDAAVIKPFLEGTPIVGSGCIGGPGSQDLRRFACQYVTLKMLLMQAYQLKAQEIIGPDWLDENHFDVTAKVSPGAAREQVPAMLRDLLAERFKVVSHRETRVLPGYAITVTKGGVKVAAASPTPAATPAEEGASGKPSIGSDGFPVLPRSATAAGPVILYRQGRARLQGSETTMMQLAEALSRQLSGVVVDETALSGKYDITLNWTREKASRVRLPGGRPEQALKAMSRAPRRLILTFSRRWINNSG